MRFTKYVKIKESWLNEGGFKGFLIILLLCVVSLPMSADAYQLLGFKKKDNLDLYYNISKELIDMGYKQDILRGFTAWHSTNKVKFTKEVSISGNVNYVNSNYGGAFATYRNGFSTLSNKEFYKSWNHIDQTCNYNKGKQAMSRLSFIFLKKVPTSVI